MKITAPVILVMLVTLVTGCISSRDFVSVEGKFSKERMPSGFHRVSKGETLFSIAWRYGLDLRQLANANSISKPYTIYPGQKIDIDFEPKPVALAKRPTVGKTSKQPVTNKVRPKVKPKNGHKSPAKAVVTTSADWKWPVNGRLIGRFSTRKPVNKGIDIAGSLGESVLAAAAGTVVYAGRGLRGYGNLVIVKHNDTYLSAYAHTSRIVVSEQDVVKAGQKIAELGSTGTDKVKLHFEIRKNGKPVDPLNHLPKHPG